MTQIEAEALGTPVSKVIFELGHTGQPEAPVSGGLQTVASVGPAVYAAAEAARDKLTRWRPATSRRRCMEWTSMR